MYFSYQSSIVYIHKINSLILIITIKIIFLYLPNKKKIFIYNHINNIFCKYNNQFDFFYILIIQYISNIYFNNI